VDGSDPEYSSLSGIADFKMTGLEQVAVWTRYREFDEKNPGKSKARDQRTQSLRISERGTAQDCNKGQSRDESNQEITLHTHLERQNSRISWTRSHTESQAH